MEKTKNSNSGFTLVELIVAMAVLAFLMTAICSLMGSSSMSYKKTKTEINMQNSAQEVYNQISDSVMQATDIAVVGYEVVNLNFGENGAEVNAENLGSLTCFVKSEKVAKKFQKELNQLFPDGYDTKLLSKLDSNKNIVVKAIIVDNSVDIDPDECNMDVSLSKWELNNALTNEKDVIKRTNTVDPTKPVLFDTYDTCRLMYTFEEDSMYLQRKYAYMNDRTDVFSDASKEAGKENCLFSKMLSYVKVTNAGGKSFTGCLVKIKPEEGSIDLKMYFRKKTAEFITDGKINIRNSFVLKDKKVVLTSNPEAGNEEGTPEETPGETPENNETEE